MVAPCVHLYVVGVDLQLRLGVDRGIVGQQQGLVGLLGVGLLGVLANEDLAVEDAVGLAVENALVQLMAGAVRPGVVDLGVVIDMLRPVDDVQPVQGASDPSERVALTSLRTSAPPREMECEEKAALRPMVACSVAMWNALVVSCCTL